MRQFHHKTNREVWETFPLKFNIHSDKEIAEAAHDRIFADFKKYETVNQVAEAIGTSAYKLRNAFKKHYGISLFISPASSESRKPSKCSGKPTIHYKL